MSITSKLRALRNLPMREAVYILRNKVVPYKHTPMDRVPAPGCVSRLEALRGRGAGLQLPGVQRPARLEESIMRLGETAVPGARFIHLVNYGNHGGTAYPFKGIYTCEPDAWFAANGRGLNLKRHPDILAALRAAGFETGHYTLDEALTLAQQPSPWWLQRYSEPDLLKRVVIYHGRYEG